MEIIDTALIERIRKALIKRYDRDQQIQQMIEEIGAEEGLNETELAIVYQAYLEVKERIYYTSSLVDLWNQIEEVQKRMSMLHTYDSLEEDLFGNVLGDDKEDIIILMDLILVRVLVIIMMYTLWNRSNYRIFLCSMILQWA